MDGSFMTAVEQKHYSELFSKSDVDNTGKVATSRVRNLFLSSQLSNETLQQIVELCGAKRVGHFGRSQFYFALKLIAMAQNGLPLPPSIDKINTGVEVPLPAFSSTWRSEGKGVSDPNRQMEFINPAFIDNPQEPTEDYDYPPIKQDPPAEWKGSPGFKAGGIPPPLQRNSRTGNSLYQVANSPRADPPQNVKNTTPLTPPSSPKQAPASPSFHQNSTPPTSPRLTGRVLERHMSLPSSPREVPSLKDKSRHSIDIQPGMTPRKIPTKDGGWASFEEVKEEKAEQNNHQQTPAKSQQTPAKPQQTPVTPRQTPAKPAKPQSGDEDASWAKFPEKSGGDQPELKHSVSIPGSEGSASDEDVWLINTEQRTYYTNQFQRLQPEPFGLLAGPEAKGFFEKSKLPTTELSRIWKLSDVNKDGTLSLEEFCTAMHLVVLRKHSISLPDKLPASLVPQVGAPAAEEEAPTSKQGQEQDGKSTEQTKTTTKTVPTSVSPPAENNKAKIKDENWAKFHDSPLPRPPSPSSQSPANFDFASISPDPEAKIFQPIPLHVSPSGNRSIVVEQRARTHSGEDTEPSDPIRQDSSSDHEYDVPPPTLPEKKKRANTLDNRTPAKLAPPPPIEKSRRGDSLERMPASPYYEEKTALPRPRSRSCSGNLPLSPLSKIAPREGALVESTAESGEGDVPIPPLTPGEVPSPQYEIRLRAASLDSSVYRTKFRTPKKDFVKERTIPELNPFESTQIVESATNGANNSIQHDIKDISDVFVEPPPPPDAPPPPPPDAPPPLAPPPALDPTPIMSTPPPPPPPLRWRSASLDSRFSRPRIRTTLKQLTLDESVEETPAKSKEDLNHKKWVKESLFIDEVNLEGPSSFNSVLASFPPIAPPPNIDDIRARSSSLDYKIFRRERNSDMGHHIRPSIPPRPGAQKTFPSQTSKSSSVQSSASSSRSSSISRSSSSHSSSAGEDDDDDDETNGHTESFADFSKFESMTESPTPESTPNRVASAKYTPVDSTPRLSPPPPARPRQQMLEDHSCTDRERSAFLASKERHKSGDELQAERKRDSFAHDRTRHASAPDPLSSTQDKDYDRKSIQAAIRRAKEENTKLSRLNSELQQELKQMMEDRIALETQLERLRPFSTTS